MEMLFFVIMVLMLLAFGYAQQERGVFRTPGKITLHQEDEAVHGRYNESFINQNQNAQWLDDYNLS